MRAIALAALCGLTFSAVAGAQAQDRPLVIDVKPRSWLDAGKTVQVGSMQNYMYDTQGLGDSSRFGSRSSGALPDRFSSGRGAFVFEMPRFTLGE